MRHRSRAATVALLVLGVGLITTAFGGHLQSAHASTTPPDGSIPLGVFSLIGDATGVIVSEDQPSANAHPEGQGSAPESSSMLTNGPVGYGLAALGWPGATEGNAGGLVILLFPGPVGNALQGTGVHFPDAVTAAVDQNANLLNYPIRAEARSGSHQDAVFSAPSIDLKSHADATIVDAAAHLKGATQPGQASYGDTQTESKSELVGNLGRVTANSTATNIDIAGVVKIGSITSTATAQTNGLVSSGSGNTTVTRMTIGGTPAYVDKTGVHAGSVGENPIPVLDQVVQQTLGNAGITMAVSEPLLATKAAATTYTAGSLIILWAPPHSSNLITASFGGARVSVDGQPGSSLPSLLPAPTPTLPIMNPSGTSTSPGMPGVAPSATPSQSTSAVAPSRTAHRTRPGSGSAPIRLITARTFAGIKVGWVLLAGAGIGLLFAGARRLAFDLLDRTTGSCPLESTGR